MLPLVARCHEDLDQLLRSRSRESEARQHEMAAATLSRQLGMAGIP
jgi:hypothetical protein